MDAFERAVGGRFPENRILSHDLLEGSYARSALVSDVQLFEEFPSRYRADIQRRHRWMRGDWQIASWLLPRVPGADVRRRAKSAVTDYRAGKFSTTCGAAWFRCAGVSAHAGLVFASGSGAGLDAGRCRSLWLCLCCCRCSRNFCASPKDLPLDLHVKAVQSIALRQPWQTVLTVAFLPYDAVISLDAIVAHLRPACFHAAQFAGMADGRRRGHQNESGLRDHFYVRCGPLRCWRWVRRICF